MSSTRVAGRSCGRVPSPRAAVAVVGLALAAAVGPALAGSLPDADAPVSRATESPDTAPGATPDPPEAGLSAEQLGKEAHIQVSGTDWADLDQAANDLREHPGDPLTPLAAESPWVGPAGSPAGVTACLSSLPDEHLSGVSAVSVDLAVRAGRPVIGVVLHGRGGARALLVSRTCGVNGEHEILAGPVALSPWR